MVYFILETITVAHPNFTHIIWIDDLSQSAKGSRHMIRKQLVQVLVDTCDGLKKQKLKVATKSAVMRTFMDDAKYVARRVRHAGYPLEASSQVSYLGADLSGGRRRGRAVKRKRMNKAGVMSAKITQKKPCCRHPPIQTNDQT
eukprot:4884073-Pyramimonas_sp.AAC.1